MRSRRKLRSASRDRSQVCTRQLGSSRSSEYGSTTRLDKVAVERCVHRVAAAAEVHEIEQLQMLLQLLLGDVKALDDLVRGDDSVVPLAAGCEKIGEQGLQHREALRDDGPRRALAGRLGARH